MLQTNIDVYILSDFNVFTFVFVYVTESLVVSCIILDKFNIS